jgi:CRP-like cAMP-binding protein
MNKKRTATIITKEKSYFAILSKKVYDSYLKIAQLKSRIKKMLYFTEGPIFKGLLPGTFLNKYFFRIKNIECPKGKILFNRDDLRNKIYFIVKGEFELSGKMTLNEISEIIEKLGGICDNKKEKYLCRLYDEFKKFYLNNKINAKVCVINKNKVIGLDDMCINNKYIFDCKCISTDETEIYEFDYKNFEDALKENELIMKNNIKYVNKRRELYIRLLFEQRNSIVEIEYRKIRKKYKMKKKLSETDLNKKNNILIL